MKAAIKFCLDHDILKEFLELHSTEVFNMLLTEWDTEKAKVVWYEEGLEKGLQEGLEKGLMEGLQKGRDKGILETARNALRKGLSIETVCDITGLDEETIKGLVPGTK